MLVDPRTLTTVTLHHPPEVTTLTRIEAMASQEVNQATVCEGSYPGQNMASIPIRSLLSFKEYEATSF